VSSKRSRLLVCVAAFAAHAALATPTFGAECNGVTAPDTVTVGGSDLVLNGMGIRRATLLRAKIYVGSLYLPEKSKDGGHILATDRPWQLVLRFVRDVDISDMRDALEVGLSKAAGDKLVALSQSIETLKASKVDFKKGQYLSFTSDPTNGVAVDVNGAGGPTIRGGDFSLALLSMWIGAEPRDAGLKAGLLGGACE
jgi:Chalcone isomerase-like